jgi:ABC-type multidrug transport system fused ATPase/permease subunit
MLLLFDFLQLLLSQCEPSRIFVNSRMETPLQTYRNRCQIHRSALAKQQQQSRTLSAARVAVFLLSAVAGGAALWAKHPELGPVSFVLFVIFLTLVFWHGRVERQVERLRFALEFSEQGLARCENGKWSKDERGKRFIEKEHPYANDLDLFGSNSLLSLLDTMRTDLSEERLATYLKAPSPPAQVKLRVEAVQELAKDPVFREELYVLAQRLRDQDVKLGPLEQWCREGQSALEYFQWFRVVGYILPLLTLSAALWSTRIGLPQSTWIGLLVLHYVFGFRAASLTSQGKAAMISGARAFGSFGAMLAQIRTKPWKANQLQEIQQLLCSDDQSAEHGLASLERLAGWAEAEQNEFYKLLLSPMLMIDVHIGYGLHRFHTRFASQLERWLDAFAELQALTCLGTFSFDNPSYSFAKLEDGPARFQAKHLAHPLLDRQRCVANDVGFDGPGTALLVTGSNMSGKSTLMRSIGLASVMAQAGCPVSAKDLELSPLAVRTSMRISDSVASGVSHFYAELLTLKRVVDSTSGALPVFFLLDEILHGTNSRERHQGAKSVVEFLLSQGSMGAVSTHDLNLVDLIGERVRPVHLMEQSQGDRMTFDYRLRDGVLRSGNALRLMKQLGLPVILETETSRLA